MNIQEKKITETNPEMTQMLEFAGKHSETVFITVVGNKKQNVLKINVKVGTLSGYIETLRMESKFWN